MKITYDWAMSGLFSLFLMRYENWAMGGLFLQIPLSSKELFKNVQGGLWWAIFANARYTRFTKIDRAVFEKKTLTTQPNGG